MPDAPLRIPSHFQPEQTWDLDPGDMLYLPPQYAHNGVALTDCMTWSVGFRAYPARDIVSQFLNHLQDTLEVEGVYADPHLKPTEQPGKIPADMVRQFRKMLRAISWRKRDVEEFVGRYLSEPKSNVIFDPPLRPPSLRRFMTLAQQRGLILDRRSSLLYRKRIFYMNGEHAEVAPEHIATLRLLADKRALPSGSPCDENLLMLRYEWLCAGYMELA